MKKARLTILAFHSLICFSQNPLQSVSDKYFRIHPFDMSFSNFIRSLESDPWFTVENYFRRTDSNFFFLSGSYKNFNPFHYQPEELKLVVAEEQITHDDSLHTVDTIMNLQLMGITKGDAAGKNAVMKEFKRFHNSQSGRFSNSRDNTITVGDETDAVIRNYYLLLFSIPPVTIAWGPLRETNQYTFTITIRFKVIGNMADLIIPPNGL